MGDVSGAHLNPAVTLGSETEAAARHRKVFWAIGRLFLGFLQVAGVTTSLLLLISMGLNRVSIGAVVVTGIFTLSSRILFWRRTPSSPR